MTGGPPACSGVDQFDVVRVAGIGRLRAEVRTVDGDGLRLLGNNWAHRRNGQSAGIGSAAGGDRVNRRAIPALGIPDFDRELIAGADAPTVRSIGAGEAGEHDLRIGPRGDGQGY